MTARTGRKKIRHWLTGGKVKINGVKRGRDGQTAAEGELVKQSTSARLKQPL